MAKAKWWHYLEVAMIVHHHIGEHDIKLANIYYAIENPSERIVKK